MTDQTHEEARLNNALKSIENTLVLNAEKDFNETLQNINGSKAKPNQKYDPRDLDGQISNYKDFYDRLKFLFLEQEAKEKFLRMILEQSPKTIEKTDVFKATEERDSMRLTVEEKNKQIGELTEQIEVIIQENIDKYEKILKVEELIKDKLESLNDKKIQLAQSKEKLSSFKNSDPSLPKLQDLFRNVSILSENVDESVLNSIEGMQRLIDEHLGKIHSIQKQIMDAESALSKEQLRINNEKLKYDELFKQNESLTRQIESIKQSLNDENNTTPEKLKLQNDEEKLKTLMKVWLKITNIEDFKIDDVDGSLKFRFKDYPDHECLISVDKNHKIAKIHYELVSDDVLNEMIIKSNKAKDPVESVVMSLYKIISDS